MIFNSQSSYFKKVLSRSIVPHKRNVYLRVKLTEEIGDIRLNSFGVLRWLLEPDLHGWPCCVHELF